ncbi:hypothetical protein PPGU19_102730 (plasmid) [Paraburkholderia sp. PGU19]|nr:hypothetical protein PPGU19_102730 [Paraburkholderia sp. PGU19]
MFKLPHQGYPAEFKEAAVQRVKDGQGVPRRRGRRTKHVDPDVAQLAQSVGGRQAERPRRERKVVAAEQTELSRLRAKNKRLQMELKIAKPSVCPFSSRYLRSQDTAMVCTINARN